MAELFPTSAIHDEPPHNVTLRHEWVRKRVQTRQRHLLASLSCPGTLHNMHHKLFGNE